ncbi:MAG TPA: Calx-beta domain-containing protein [Gammaproteobacteria bacterium]|nr:Calx-beta domain-containing protein [Gammaproteobacteria bacterium]
MSRHHHSFPVLAMLLAALWAPAAGAAGVLQFLEPRLKATEGQTRQITVIRSDSAVGEVTVVLNISLGGTATLGTDFTIDLPLGVIRIPDGRLFGRAQLNVPQRSGAQGTRFAILTLANPSGATLGRDVTLLLEIEDDDPPAAALEIAGDAVRRVVAGDELPIEVTRDGLPADTVSATLLGVPGTAALGIDFADLTTELEFAPGDTSADATLSTIARTAAAPPRNLSLMLANTAPAGEAAFRTRPPTTPANSPCSPPTPRSTKTPAASRSRWTAIAAATARLPSAGSQWTATPARRRSQARTSRPPPAGWSSPTAKPARLSPCS